MTTKKDDRCLARNQVRADTMSEPQNFAMEFTPTRAMRFWRWAGFHYTAYAGRPENDEARYLVHRVTTVWDWRDRLRILLTGRTQVELCVETDGDVRVFKTRAHHVTLAPGAEP